jgi:ketosteroid isomerase-like protein
MKRVAIFTFGILLLFAAVVLFVIFDSLPAKGQNVDEAMQLAKKLTEEGATTFNTANAKAMAAYYTDDAKVFLQSKVDNGISVKEYNGREEIEKLYADLFKNPGTIQSKNTVEYAKLLASDILVIAGTFEPNTQDPKSLKVPFYQVRIKQADKWLMSSLRIFVVGEKS